MMQLISFVEPLHKVRKTVLRGVIPTRVCV